MSLPKEWVSAKLFSTFQQEILSLLLYISDIHISKCHILFTDKSTIKAVR